MGNEINRVVTFYSYKGGVGRSMAMANVSVALAQWGYNILAIDWDLEAPGLENFFSSFIDVKEVVKKKGLIDLLNLKIANTDNSAINAIEWEEFITPIEIKGNSNLHLLTAGRRDDNYTTNVRRFDFSSFYNDYDGGEYLENIREQWLSKYNFIFIDSRTGLTDSSGICSIHMPDILVLLFTPNEQSFEGIKGVARKATEAQKKVIYDRFRLRTLAIPSRVEIGETRLLDKWMEKIYKESEEMFQWLPREGLERQEYLISPEQIIKQIRLPYQTLYAYGEHLAVIERDARVPSEIGFTYETIAAVIANDLQNIELLKDSRDSLLKKAKSIKFTRDPLYEEEKNDPNYIKSKSNLNKYTRQAKSTNEITTRKTILASQGISKRVISISILSILLFFIVYLTFKNISITQNIGEVKSNDSAAIKTTNFLTEYSKSENQYDFNFGLKMIKQYYELDKKDQLITKDIKNQIENTVAYKFYNLVDSFYYHVRESPRNLDKYLADTLTHFGVSENIRGQLVVSNLSELSKLGKVKNIPIDSTMSFASDSLGFIVTYQQTGNYLLDNFKKFKKINTNDTIRFNKLLKIESYKYKAVSLVEQKLKLEIFVCPSENVRLTEIVGDIVRELKKDKDLNVITRINFTSSKDPSSPYHIETNQIRYQGSEELKIAKSIQNEVRKVTGLLVPLVTARTPTENYISIFICDPNFK